MRHATHAHSIHPEPLESEGLLRPGPPRLVGYLMAAVFWGAVLAWRGVMLPLVIFGCRSGTLGKLFLRNSQG